MRYCFPPKEYENRTKIVENGKLTAFLFKPPFSTFNYLMSSTVSLRTCLGSRKKTMILMILMITMIISVTTVHKNH